MRVLDMTRIDSMVMPNPNRDVVENRKKKESYGIKDIKTVLNRMKLIIYWYQYIKTIDKPIVYYDYPRYSIFWYIILMAFAYQYNSRYLFTYLALGCFLLVFSYSELWRQYVDPVLDRVFFREELKNPLVIYDHQVRTSG